MIFEHLKSLVLTPEEHRQLETAIMTDDLDTARSLIRKGLIALHEFNVKRLMKGGESPDGRPPMTRKEAERQVALQEDQFFAKLHDLMVFDERWRELERGGMPPNDAIRQAAREVTGDGGTGSKE